MNTLLLIWIIIGTISSLLAIYVFRRDGTTDIKGELYLATLGPWFGPVITILLIIDSYKIVRSESTDNQS